LEEFLARKIVLSIDEKKYLHRYVKKGIPTRLHGRVSIAELYNE
jgi:hypothetical protein